MKFDPGIHIVMHSFSYLKPGVTRPLKKRRERKKEIAKNR
jgi:hypothetical protein